MQKKSCLALVFVASVFAFSANAEQITLNAYVDDYGQVSIDGNSIGSYDNPAAAGNIIDTLDLAPGWHDISIDYKNRAGTNFLGLSWQMPGDVTYTLVPLDDLRSLDAGSNTVSGLKADYYDLSGNFQFTVYGEGPIANGALSFSDEIYENAPGLWAGVYGPSSDFEERLNGQIDIPAQAPEPSGFVLSALGIGSLGFFILRRRTRAE